MSVENQIERSFRMDPYIGITDFFSFSEVEDMLGVFNAHKKPTSRLKLHIGVMMSHKTLHGIPSRWDNAFPPKETIADIFQSDETMNTLHYADFDGEPGLEDSLVKALTFAGPGVHALQLDMVFPNPREIAGALSRTRKHLEVIIQINKKSFELVTSPEHLCVVLEEYKGVATRVLLDKSMGKGLGMDARGLLPYLAALQDSFPDIGLVVAGGLGPETMHLVAPVVAEFSDISIDAQGQLRASGSALDPRDRDRSANYLIEALKILQ